MSSATITKQVPATALSAPATLLMAGELEANKQPVRLQARSKGVLDHWYWGRMVHDFAGMLHKASIPIDYCHDSREILGYCDQFDVTDYGLELAGQLVTVRDDDRAAEVAAKAKADVPYEASILFNHDALVIEYVTDGATTEVNGEQLAGPLVVFREWKLSGVAICPHGYDDNTSTELARREGKMFALSIQGGSAMPTSTATTPEAPASKPATDNKPADTKQTELGGDNKPENKPANTPEGDPKAQVMTELKRFTDRFGADGSTYFVDGLSFEAACDKHARKLETELAARDEQVNELQTKLSAVVTGEEAPVSAGKTEDGETPQRKNAATGLAKAIRISGRPRD